MSSRLHCGARDDCLGNNAGEGCATGEVCSAGTCALSCQTGLVNCGGTCVDPLTDRLNCGAVGDCQGVTAGVHCLAGKVCSAGTCALSCQTGLVNCGGTCVDPLTDRFHCGARLTCGGGDAGAICAAGEVCVNGGCQLSCQAGLVKCGPPGGEVCINPESNPGYCGARGTCQGTIPSGLNYVGEACQGDEVCQDGSCDCLPGLTPCGDHSCVDTSLDRANCGGCGNTSSVYLCGDGEICISGGCELSCPPGLTLCGAPGEEFCTNPLYDPENCGGCAGSGGVDCTASAPLNTDGFCNSGGSCTYDCKPGYIDCSGNINVSGCSTVSSCGKVVFVTSQSYQGDFGGVAGGDALCQAAANGATPLSGISLSSLTFKAWLSDYTVSPSTSFTRPTGAYITIGGHSRAVTVVAMGWAQFASDVHLAPIDRDQNGNVVNRRVWTGTKTDGTRGYLHCGQWTVAEVPSGDDPESGTYGMTSVYLDLDWTGENDDGGHGLSCEDTLSLYCVAQ